MLIKKNKQYRIFNNDLPEKKYLLFRHDVMDMWHLIHSGALQSCNLHMQLDISGTLMHENTGISHSLAFLENLYDK